MASTNNDSKKSPESSAGEEHLHRLLGPQAPRLPQVSEPLPSPTDEDLQPRSTPSKPEDTRPSTASESGADPLEGVKEVHGLSDEEAESYAEEFGF